MTFRFSSISITHQLKIGSLLPANPDKKRLPFDQAQSGFVGRRGGVELISGRPS